ncbi:SIR2 family protein [Streptomyces sp. NPDC090085]|uniref:SIR2 family protein n=1 Tax=Streptomyces sp. NPDC090085 TaxID=3365943 RepID=UPI0037F8CA46
MGSEENDVTSPVVVPAGGLIEPQMALAMNVHASPGVYALLLGAGISIASGVKTGWGVVQDIVGKVAAVRDPGNPDVRAEAMADPEKWWEANSSDPLGYSALLAAAAPKPASRQAMLAGYFEPEDGEDNSKGPTAAHRAIAQLVKRGSIRVILTTNFDRLTERALQEVRISPQVVHRPDQIDAIQPLAHSQVTVIKLHGDYADLEQRNTVDELETYPEAQQHLLERVLDEYGLIVCGWSADWDKALARAVAGTRSRRYPMFWSHYGRLGEDARRLTAQHSAVVIEGKSADELFTGLVQQIEALDRTTVAPISRDVAVVRLKRALPDPVRRIELFDLVDQAVTDVTNRATAENRPTDASPNDEAAEVFGTSLRGYRADSDVLLHLLANGVFHDDGTHDELWHRAVTRLVRMRDTTPSSYVTALEALRHLPALLASWTVGVASILSDREELLVSTLTRPLWTHPHSNHPRRGPAWFLNPLSILHADGLHTTHRAENGGRLPYPQSNWLKGTLREPFRLVEPSDVAYWEACSRFEFLASMIAMDTEQPAFAQPWAGEYLGQGTWGYDGNGLAAAVRAELTSTWPLLNAGAFGGDLERAEAALTALSNWRNQNARHW